MRAALVEDLIGAEDDVASVEMTVAIVFTVRDGKVFSGREYATREEALEAAGLRK